MVDITKVLQSAFPGSRRPAPDPGRFGPSPLRLSRLTILSLSAACVFLIGGCSTAWAQQPESGDTAAGAKLVEKGKFADAIKVLHRAVAANRNDGEAWNLLGIADFRSGLIPDALTDFEQGVFLQPKNVAWRLNLASKYLLASQWDQATEAAKATLVLDPHNFQAHFIIGQVGLMRRDFVLARQEADAALQLNAAFGDALILRGEAIGDLLARRIQFESQGEADNRVELLHRAIQALETFIQLYPNDLDADAWREQLETLKWFAAPGHWTAGDRDRFSRNEDSLGTGSHKLTPIMLIRRPKADYTKEARREYVTGTVRLSAVFTSDGTIIRILVLDSLGYGLTGQAVRALRKIEFKPAKRDGNDFSAYATIEYNFHID